VKIAISAMGKDLDSMLDVRFGRCNYFVIYDTEEEKFSLLGKIPYDDTVMKSKNELVPIIYYRDSKASKAMRQLWEKLCEKISLIGGEL